MNFLDRIIQLPKISIKQLERKVRNTHPTGSSNFSPNKENQLHSQAIIVVSPFYSRLQNHPLKCECHFHRLKKTNKLYVKKFQPKQSTTQLKENQFEKKDLKNIPSALRPYILNTQKITPQDLKLLAYENTDSFSLLKQEKQRLQTKRNDSEPKLAHFQLIKLQGNTINSKVLSWNKLKKIDANNTQFIEIISKRLENDKYKSSYLKTLFRFIKMKTDIDKFYMWNSKAYLSNALNLLLNHFSMQKLMKFDELNETDIEKIAFYMGCLNKQVKPILRELTQSVAEMQVFLEQIRKKQEKSRLAWQNKKQQQKRKSSLLKINSYQGTISHQISTNSLLMDEEKERRNKKNYIITEQYDNQKKRHSTKGSSLNLRKSVLKSTLQFGSTLIKTIDNIQNQQKSQKQTKEIKNVQENIRQNIRENIRSSQNSGNLAAITRNTRSTVFATINECRGESRHSTLKKTKISKSRKIKIVHLPKHHQDFVDKYSEIKYEKFCSKTEFSHLIDQIQRLDQNDQQRAQKMFNILKVQQFINDSEKIDELIQTFAPLFADRWKDKLLKHIIMVKDRKYIQKLSHQLDFLLSQVKRTDPRHFNNQDLCPYKQDPILKNSCNQRIIRCRYSIQDNGRLLKKLKTTYNQPQEKIDKNRFTEDEKKLNLQQADLNEIKAQALQPILTQSVYNTSKTKKETIYIKPQEYTSTEQKKILQYMHSKHHNTFDYLSSQITTLCNKLG